MDTFNLFRDETIGEESDPPGYRAQSARLARHDESLDHLIRRSPDLDYWDRERP